MNPELDLKLTRHTILSPEVVWRALTDPKLLMQWFVPRPYKLADCLLDLRPGGQFFTVIESPEGEQFSGDGCILEVVPNREFVFTNALGPDFRPQPSSDEDPLMFTARITLSPTAEGTEYAVLLTHGDAASRAKHEAMQFETGWGAAFEQLVELMSKTV